MYQEEPKINYYKKNQTPVYSPEKDQYLQLPKTRPPNKV